MKEILSNSFIKISSIAIFVFIILNPINTDIAISKDIKYNELINKISKDYTNKFCNSIGFGLSKESAMNFALKENKQIFINRKGIENIDLDLLSNTISISVIERCGYPIGLSGQEGIINFKEYYIEKSNEIQ
tara:strand:+ start:155 stop:550 length:396 start_codon:yes stop_codon:yes gene_type:complete